MGKLRMTIDGRLVPGESSFGVINPATGEVFDEAPECTRDQLEEAFAAAARAFPAWRTDVDARRAALRRCSEVIKAHSDELAQLVTREQGKPLSAAAHELEYCPLWLEHTATLDLPVDVVKDTADNYVEVWRRPLGVVAAITPWNYPVVIAIAKIAPALMAGNTLVLKPSPFTPLATLRLGELLMEALPPGVVNIVSGGDQLGAWMTSHPTPRKVSFTGSVATGKKIMEVAAKDLKRLTLELGGNDPALVLPDVDPKAVANDLFWGAFENSGQVCAAIKRVYVHESQHSAFVSELSQLASTVKMGEGFGEGVELGPLNNKPQLERVDELVEDAKSSGAHIATGGKIRSGSGYFYEPTIVDEIADDTRLVTEEQFGPALPIMTYTDLDDAIERANAGHFGLCGSVWSNDTDRAAEVGGRLECGTAWINQHLAIVPFAPFGGHKWSGVGVEHSTYGLAAYTEIQTVNVKKG